MDVMEKLVELPKNQRMAQTACGRKVMCDAAN